MAFGGNPNVTITAIDVTGGIASSRTSGQTPCFIQVSGSAITATGTSLPYEDLEYSWDFGDASGTETFTNPGVCGGTVNANTAQTGPEAVYCYRTAGTYTVTLTVRGKNGSGYTTATKTQDITVTTFSASGGEYWFDSVSGNDANDGLSIGAPKQTLSAMQTVLNSTSNRAVHVKRGSSYSGTTTLDILGGAGADRSGIRLDAYGSGALPQFNVTAGNTRAMRVGNGGGASPSAKSDIVVSNIKFSNSDTHAATSYVVQFGANGNAAALVDNIYLDGCTIEVTTSGSCLQSSGTGRLSRFGYWNVTTLAPLTTSVDSIGIFTSGTDWFFVFGGYHEGASLDNGGRNHHIYPDVQNHCAYRWIDFGPGTDRNYCINCNWDRLGATAPEYTQYHMISDCNLDNLKRGHDMGNGTNDPAEVLFKNVVCQKNKFSLIGDGQLLFSNAETYTNRDNEVILTGTGRWYAPNPLVLGSILTTRMYRNKIYHDSTARTDDIISLFDTVWTNLLTITDNIFQDMRTLSRISAIPFTQQAGATIDRNQYYAPNDADATFLRDGTTGKTFAQWQAAGFDGLGSVANPSWPDPANGDFGTNAICGDDVDPPDPEPTPQPPTGGGGAAHPTKIKHEKQRRERQKKNQNAIEDTIRLAYQRLTGKVTEPPILQQEATPERLAVHAEQLAEQLVEKSKESAKQRTRNKQIIADLKRQANILIQEEEEAIVAFLFH